MALGLDPRFDLSHAYFLVAGIAGGNPNRISLGSAAWAEWIVDGELEHMIDPREIPANWTTGFVPLRKSTPYEQPLAINDDQAFHLNSALVDWAYQITKDTKLDDNDTLRARRMMFPQAAAQRPPFVMKGDEISSSTFWHGKQMSDWASQWVSYYTAGQGNYTTTAMEETGTLQSLRFLAKAGKLQINRVLVLRTVSNFDQQRPGVTAAESLSEQKIGKYGAYIPSLEAAYRVGHLVADEITDHWDKYKTQLPAIAAK
jgi:purine nucleoside permease